MNSDELLRHLLYDCNDLSVEATRSIVMDARKLLAERQDLYDQITKQVLSWVKRAAQANPGGYGGKTVYQWDAENKAARIKLLAGNEMLDAEDAAKRDPAAFDHAMRMAADSIEQGKVPPPALSCLVAQVLRGEIKRPSRRGKPSNSLVYRNSICIGLVALRCAGHYPADLAGDMESGAALIADAINKDETTIAEIWGSRKSTLEQVPAWHLLVQRVILNEQ